jgi:hypothetical protein
MDRMQVDMIPEMTYTHMLPKETEQQQGLEVHEISSPTL